MRMLRVLLVVLSLVWPRGVASETRLWVGIQRPTDLDPTNGTKETLTLRSHVQCAMKATMSPWSYMFKYEAEECILYDRKEDSQGHLKLSDNTNTPTTFTRLHNVCIVGDNIYQEGEEMLDEYCRQQRCTNRTFEPVIYAPGLPCRDPFVEYQGWCLYLHMTKMNWCNARQYCVRLGGDLAFNSTVKTMRDYVADQVQEGVWIGGKYRKWLDGRELPTQSLYPWYTGGPNGAPDYCIHLLYIGNSFLLDDLYCYPEKLFLCQLV